MYTKTHIFGSIEENNTTLQSSGQIDFCDIYTEYPMTELCEDKSL